jgi:hypothetical protein
VLYTVANCDSLILKYVLDAPQIVDNFLDCSIITHEEYISKRIVPQDR